jgi:Clp amino terminal domain, pathogenicity island component
MSRLEVADLVVIAAGVLDLSPAAALDLLDLEAAEAALAEAGRCCDRDPVEVGAAALLAGLVRHRPLARGNQQVALAATLQLLALHGWDLDLDPPAAARDLVGGLAAGTVGRPELVDWIAARLRPHAKEDRMLQRLTRRRRDRTGDHALGPFERFTDRARRTVTLAQDEARGLGHNYLGTEHLLLGLLAEGQGVAWRVLDHLGVSAATARAQVEAIIGRGYGTPAGPIPFTPRSKKVLELAGREAKRLCHNFVGTEHLLLGLVREGEGVAAQVLASLGADRARVVEETMQVLATSWPPAQQTRKDFLLDELAQVFDDNQRLAAEVERLQALLRRHGIQTDGGTTRTA